MKKQFFHQAATVIRVFTTIVVSVMLTTGGAWGVVIPPPGFFPLNQINVPEPRPLYQYIKNKPAAIRLGKALFWDMQTGSDGIQACGSCHFSAGADNRLKNTLNPGLRAGDNVFGNNSLGAPGFPQFAPNYTLQPTDFPFHERQEPVDLQTSPILRDTNDVIGSQGVRFSDFIDVVPGSRFDNVAPRPDPVFNVNGDNMRRVTARNTPSVINAIFNFTNFWDGRANNIFNGVNPFGPLDQGARIWVNEAGTLVQKQIAIDDASLASQATGPPMDDIEMSAHGRTFPKLGRKMLSLTPLGIQLVHPGDSVLGTLSRAVKQPDGSITGDKGLKTAYADMIKAAFLDQYWNSPQLTPDGFTQMEANFSLFWGLAIQLYEATLVSDNTPFDRWLGGDSTALTTEQQVGFTIFNLVGCTICHAGSELTTASVGAAAFIRNADNNLIELMTVAAGFQAIYDDGFNNLAVRPTSEDLARGGTAPFTNPLTNLPYPLSFVRLAELWQTGLLPFETPLMPQFLPPTFPTNADGTFKVPQLRNVELTAPYFHNGSVGLLQNVVDFYARGGNFPQANMNDLDPFILGGIPILQNNPANESALIAFMMSLTDERVRNESEPFDHPEILIPNGAPDVLIRIPAKGADGVAAPALPTVTINPVTSPTVQASQLISGAKEAGATIQVKVNNGLSTPADTTTDTTWSTTVTGLVSGINTIAVTATDMAGGATTLNANIQVAGESAPVTAVTLEPNLASPQAIGTPVVFTAQGQGGIGSYEYEFWLHNGTSWSKVQAYSATSNWNWSTTAATPGTFYTIQVNARNAGSSASYEAYQARAYQIVQVAATGATLVTDKPSPQPTATPGGVTFTATGSGGTGSYEFEFWQHNGVSWSKVQPYSANGNWVWDTAAASPGFYTVQVNVRSAGSTASYEAYQAISYKVTSAATATGATLVTDKASPQPTATPGGVTFTATGEGGSGSYEFEFWQHNGVSWSKVQPYSANGNWVWDTAAASPGIYTVQVNVRSAGSTASYEAYQAGVFELQ